MRLWIWGFMSVALALCPAFGHHSFSAEYDRNQPVTVRGTVSRVEWMNPHATVYVDAPSPSGKMISWEFELASPNGLMRIGWNRYSLKKGDQITVKGFKARDGSHLANANLIVLSNGSVLNPLSSGDEGAK